MTELEHLSSAGQHFEARDLPDLELFVADPQLHHAQDEFVLLSTRVEVVELGEQLGPVVVLKRMD